MINCFVGKRSSLNRFYLEGQNVVSQLEKSILSLVKIKINLSYLNDKFKIIRFIIC